MKTFLSIGTGPGMGLATSARFAREGFHVVLSARRIAETEGLAARLRADGHSAEARTVDAIDRASIRRLVAEVEAERGGIDVLHYNAAAMHPGSLLDQADETFTPDLAVNIGGALIAAQHAGRGMVARKRGTILLTGGGYAVWPSPDFLSLSIGKAGIRALALGTFDQFRASGVHVATVTVVAASILPGSPEAEAVGQLFWDLHAQPQEAWTAEATYTPGS